MNGVEIEISGFDRESGTQEEDGETETETGGSPAHPAAARGRASRIQGQ